MKNMNAMTPTETSNYTDLHSRLAGYIMRQLKKELGEEKYKELDYMTRELLMERYEAEHQEELSQMFPGVSL